MRFMFMTGYRYNERTGEFEMPRSAWRSSSSSRRGSNTTASAIGSRALGMITLVFGVVTVFLWNVLKYPLKLVLWLMKGAFFVALGIAAYLVQLLAPLLIIGFFLWLIS